MIPGGAKDIKDCCIVEMSRKTHRRKTHLKRKAARHTRRHRTIRHRRGGRMNMSRRNIPNPCEAYSQQLGTFQNRIEGITEDEIEDLYGDVQIAINNANRAHCYAAAAAIESFKIQRLLPEMDRLLGQGQ